MRWEVARPTMDEVVGIHCYRCPAVVAVESRAPEEGLRHRLVARLRRDLLPRMPGTSPPPPGQAVLRRQVLKLASAFPGGVAAGGCGINPTRARPTRRAGRPSKGAYLPRCPGQPFRPDSLAGLSTTPVAVAALTVVGLPLSRFWGDRTQRQTKQAIGISCGGDVFWLVVQP
jgi:hypothetical protein